MIPPFDLNTSHVNLQLNCGRVKDVTIYDLNTSHVNLQQARTTGKPLLANNLNTSHVNLQLECFVCDECFHLFKYISC